MAADGMTAETRPPNIMLSMLSVLSMLPMLRIPEKKTTSVDLFGPLSRDIARKYSKFEDENLRDELQTLNDRRSQLENLAKEPSFTVRLGLLLSYFRALYEIKTLFSFPKDQIYNLTFTWHDAFKPNKKASQKNIDLEEAAVLFNVGAVYSQIGQSKDRSTEEGWREAVQAFRLAAGAFAFLKGYAAAEAAMGKSTTVDMSKECTGMLEKLMLAQAQECWFQIAIDKGITPGECAKVSRQVALYYEEALAALNAALLKGHVYQKWKSYMQLKAAFFNAGACYGLGLKLHEEGKVAEEIARLKRGISILSEAKKPTKGRIHQLWNVSTKIKKISDAIDKLKDKMNGSLTKAEKDMDLHTGVPSPDSLPSLPSRSLVKQPIPINVVLDAVGVLAASNERPFASLVSHGNAIALCGSTEWVDVINIQAHEDKLQQCNEHIRARLEKMDLQYYSLSPEGHLTLPADLKKDVEAIQISGGPAGLQSELQQLQDLGQAILGLVFQTKQHLQTTPQSSTRAKNLQDQLNAIIDNLKQAAETDAHIERLVKCHSALMSILDSRPVESAFPDISLDPKEDATVKALKKDLRELETLGAQGEGLQQDLKDMNGEDDIQRKSAASMGSLEDLFEEEISKYDCLCKDIDQNIEARKRLLLKIQAQNDQLSSFPNLEKYKASCQKFYEKFQAAISKYQEIKQEIDQERNFYNTLQKTVTRVKQHCGESMTQNIQYPGTIGFESDVNGQAASNFVAGRDEGAIQKILKMGRETWDRDTVVRALRAASNNPYRALEYLYWGIPEQAEVPPAAQVSPGAQAANPPAQSAPGQLPSAMPQAVTVTPEEREDIEELAGLGFDWAIVRDVYFESNKNKEMTANFLLDMNTTTDSRK